MIAAPVDLLVIGGQTIDHFADGSAAPGGSALHIARATAPRGSRVAVITVAGPEPEAQAGLDELRGLAISVVVIAAEATAAFAHHDSAGGRQLWLERRGGQLPLSRSSVSSAARAVLLAPVAGEIDARMLGQLEPGPVRAAILQGWLRSLDEGTDVRQLSLRGVGSPLVDALSGFDLLVASREDLAADSDEPPTQLAALRRAVGQRPALVLTDGADGAWIDADGSGPQHVPVPWRVETALTVGAGDILAALLAVAHREPGSSLEQRTRAAMRTVAEVLEQRRG